MHFINFDKRKKKMPPKKRIKVYIPVDPTEALKIKNPNVGNVLKEFFYADFTETEKKILANTLFSRSKKIFDIGKFVYQGHKFEPYPVSEANLKSVKLILNDYNDQLKIFYLSRTWKSVIQYPVNKIETLLRQVLPYNEEITNIDLDGEYALYFIWRKNQYRITTDLFVKEVDGNLLVDNRVTLLMEQLLRLHKANITR